MRAYGDLTQCPSLTRDAASAADVRDAWHDHLDAMISALASQDPMPQPPRPGPPVLDPDDPQKGRWGGQSRVGPFELTATVERLKNREGGNAETPDGRRLFNVRILAHSTDPARPLTGTVRFHLHPTFVPSSRDVIATGNQAELRVTAYGAFTAGTELFEPRVALELDLAQLQNVPVSFRNA
jgi:hypothetical protein